MNKVILMGRLTRDPELRTTGSGISVATFTLAVDRQFTNASGQREADFISCVIWRKAAENFCNFTSKGSLVGIQGRIQTRNYDNKDGQRVYVTEVLVDNFSLLESRRERESRQQNGGFGGYGQGQSQNSGFNSGFGGGSGYAQALCAQLIPGFLSLAALVLLGRQAMALSAARLRLPAGRGKRHFHHAGSGRFLFGKRQHCHRAERKFHFLQQRQCFGFRQHRYHQ